MSRDVGIERLLEESELGRKIWNAAIEAAAVVANKDGAHRAVARIRELKK